MLSPAGETALAEATGDARTGDLVLEMALVDLVGAEAAARFGEFFEPDEKLEWQTFVPASYDVSRPPGLLVYVSPTQSGDVPRGWKEVLEEHNLIWLAANRSGNRELVGRRVLLAILAANVAGKHYRIDEKRTYISGLSGGGKTASMIATDYPDLFKGGIYNCGAMLWDDTPKRIDQVRQNRFVFVSGTHDQALEPTRQVFRAYREAGIENSKLMVIRNMTHRNPGRYQFEEAIEYLEAGTPGAAQ